MSVFKFGRLVIEDTLDKDDELEIELDEEHSLYIWLPREEVINLRDHLNRVLGVTS